MGVDVRSPSLVLSITLVTQVTLPEVVHLLCYHLLSFFLCQTAYFLRDSRLKLPPLFSSLFVGIRMQGLLIDKITLYLGEKTLVPNRMSS